MKAIALENGTIGQTIRIQNPTSGKELYGKVIHENSVEVIR
jgi:flagella basal body P-ring formation protein FlgA